MPDQQNPTEGHAKQKNQKAILAAVCVGVVLIVVGILYFTGVFGPAKDDLVDIEDGAVPYAEGVVVLKDDGIYDVLEPNAIALEFKNDAYSQDGKTFACYLGNSSLNEHDMYVAIYSDAELTDELYVSGLVRPGSGFEEITLNKALDKGDHRVYIAFTQMEDQKTIRAQTLYTMDFHVIPD